MFLRNRIREAIMKQSDSYRQGDDILGGIIFGMRSTSGGRRAVGV